MLPLPVSSERLRACERAGLPFDLSVCPGLAGARYRSVLYVAHQLCDMIDFVRRDPLAPEAYTRLTDPWGLVELVPDAVYRSAEPRCLHYPRVRELGIRTLVCVKRSLPSEATLRFADEHKLELARLDLGPDRAISLSAVEQARELLQRRELWPVLLHCDGGRHRTGIVSAALRRSQGWSLEAALEEYERYAAPTPRECDREAICAVYGWKRVLVPYAAA